MSLSTKVLIIISSLSFLFYGAHCLKSDYMKLEFKRYGLEKFRTLTGVLEILGGLGLLIGLEYKFILQFSSLGLCLLMLSGLVVRIKIKDRFTQILPALILFLFNFYIFIN
jgi:hypothetical protein